MNPAQTLLKLSMASNEDLEKRIENLEKEVQHLKAALQYQTKRVSSKEKI